jgi:hypothetical protein
MTPEEIKAALAGHENAQAIMDVLESPTEVHEAYDRKRGYVVGQDFLNGSHTEPESGEVVHNVHRLPHWRDGFTAEAFEAHQARQRDKRDREGLAFLERPHRKGRFTRTGPKTQAKVNTQYLAQLEAENNGETYTP